jgi:NTE family protein
MGADEIIAVDISTPLKQDSDPESYAGVIARLSGFLTKGNVKHETDLLGVDDVLIEPNLGDITVARFDRVAEAVEIGRQAARDALDRLRRLSLSEAEFAAHIAGRRSAGPPAPVIDGLRMDNEGPLADRIVAAHVRQRVGDPLDADALLRDLSDLYGLEYFEPITFDLDRQPQHTELVIHARPRRTGLSRLRFGLDLENDFKGGSSFNLQTRYQRLAVNRTGAEWRNDLVLGQQTALRTEFYQPLDSRLRFFVAPALFYDQNNRNIIDEGRILWELRVTAWGGSVSLGSNLGRWGQLRLGLGRGVQETDVRVGLPLPDLERVNVTLGQLSLLFDTLDSPTWPMHGGTGLVTLDETVTVLGGETESSYLRTEGNWALSVGRNTIVPGIELGLALDSEENLVEGFELGGRLRLSGYSPGELYGREGLVGRLVFYRQLNRRMLRLVQPGWYVGASVEAGNVYLADDPVTFNSLLAGGSIFVGADTPLGPIVLGVGFAQPDRNRIFLSIGRSLLRR